MKLFINGKFLSQPQGGVQQFAVGICNELQLHYPELKILVPNNKNHHHHLPIQKVGILNGVCWEQVSLPLFMLFKKDALLLNLCNAAPLCCKKNIITLHDLAFEIQEKNWFKKRFKKWYRFLIPKIAKKALLIFSVSNFTKKEIIRHYNIPENKIQVIPNGVPDLQDTFAGKVPANNYVLLIGANNPRKNADWVIKNCHILKQNGYQLVVLTNAETVYQNSKLLNHPDIICKPYVAKDEYCFLLKNAKALIYPSEYEGFGIPILESLCLGTPAVVSNLEVFSESFGTMPIYFEQNNLISFNEAIKKIKQQQLSVAAIYELKNNYTFTHSAQKIIAAIEKITI